MGTSLASLSPGHPHYTYNWLLHNSGSSLATGFNVSLGNGTESPLILSAAGIGIGTSGVGGSRHELVSAATATRTWTLADSSGTLYPETLLMTSVDAPSSTTTPVEVPALEFTPIATARYEFEAVLIIRSAAVNTGVNLVINGLDSTASWVSRGPTNADSTELLKYGVGASARYDGNNVPVINVDYTVVIRGTYTASGKVTVTVNSKTTTAVLLRPNSFIRHRRIK